MPKWTNEQLEAIETTGSNIIVSAGAGSGKTAVLTERVIDKLKRGIKINELLILTFTNAAAEEMKERIRKKIQDYDELKDNLDYIDSAYITTFDAYTLSLVKKYNYLLNVSKDLSIVDQSIISIKKMEILDEVFDSMYKDNNELFNKFISSFAIKNDKSLRQAILSIINSMELIFDKDSYLNNYLDNYLSDTKIDNYINEFYKLIRIEIDNIENNIMLLEDTSYSDYYNAMVNAFDKLIKSKSYDEIVLSIPEKIPTRPKNSEDISFIKDSIDESMKTIKSYLRFNNTIEIKESLLLSKDYIKCIIEIISKYYTKLNDYKRKNDLYEFTDIELMAINLLKNNSNIRDEIKYYYKEIFVDEYQDTNDLQEEFISIIENNNVYMVGDIKQSIYGFRNANPKIFKDKYDKYSHNDNGIKIDLLKNFRSRREVLSGINEIFSIVMDDALGGADYKNSHQMIFGNDLYSSKKKENSNLEIFNYQIDNKIFSKEEVEAFIIAKDIIKKIDSNYKVIDKNTFELRNVRYEDFCIIMDRGVSFPTYKKIFEYLKIPINIYEDKKLTNETDIMVLKNIINLILKIDSNTFDTEFKYSYLSIARSYLFSYSDDYIFEVIKNNKYEDTDIYKLAHLISKDLNILNNYELLIRIIDDFDIYKNLVKVGNVEESIIRLDHLLEISRNLSDMGYTISDFYDYLNKMINSNDEIKYKGTNKDISSVKIMNIHKSKGLEFPICYYSGLYKEFNTQDIKSRFVYDKKYGIITPFYKEGIGTTILKDLLKDKYMVDDIAEKIRLFYVALTRAKEKIIIVASLDEENSYSNNIVDITKRRKYNSFLSILNSISGNLKDYIFNINLEDVQITKDYLYNTFDKKDLKTEDTNKIIYRKVLVDNAEVESKHASKEINSLITKEDKEKLSYGTYIHKVFEECDFLNIESSPYKDKIESFVKELNINENTKIYKEHEFMFEENGITYNGIIDLILVLNDEVKIVDYKLKNIDDEKYVDQLMIYYKYIKSILNKEAKLYLYSIIDSKLKEIPIKKDLVTN